MSPDRKPIINNNFQDVPFTPLTMSKDLPVEHIKPGCGSPDNWGNIIEFNPTDGSVTVVTLDGVRIWPIAEVNAAH